MRGCFMIDKRLLVDEVTLKKALGPDKWGKESYGAPEVLAPVRFDRVFAHIGTANHRSDNKPSVLLVYPRFCPVELDDSYLGAKLSDGDRDYIVRQIIPQCHPFKNEVVCYEVEVV